MLKPTSDFMFVEVVTQHEGLVLPDSRELGKGDMFKVKAIGPGYRNEEGELVKPDIEEGDTVFIVGKILRLPYTGGEVLVARSGDVIAYDREEPEPIKLGEDIEIPDAV